MPKLEDLVAFQRAVDLTVEIYSVTKTFPREELYGLTSQLRRAAGSIASNIAEGQGRLTPGERRQFLSQARGSMFEVEAHLIVAERLGFLTPIDRERITIMIKKGGRALNGYIRWVRGQEATQRPRASASEHPTNATTQ